LFGAWRSILFGLRKDVILKEPQRLKNLPFNLDAPNDVRPRATSLEDPSHSLDAPPQDDIPASIKSTVTLRGRSLLQHGFPWTSPNVILNRPFPHDFPIGRSPMGDVTQFIQELRGGDKLAADRLLTAVYHELRQLAASKLDRERPGQTLQATALVHETYLRLLRGTSDRWENRVHFFAAAAEAMRRILIESARRKARVKHGGQLQRRELQEEDAIVLSDPMELLALDEALDRLNQQDPVKAELVKLRFFAGLTVQQAGDLLGISRATADRYWTFARTWLYHELSKDESSD
jgi:RNA polymerase sigma factor (TIGR02999 family)